MIGANLDFLTDIGWSGTGLFLAMANKHVDESKDSSSLYASKFIFQILNKKQQLCIIFSIPVILEEARKALSTRFSCFSSSSSTFIVLTEHRWKV